MKIGFLSLLGLLFIGLKLGGLIFWSWWLVLLPLYTIPLLILAVLTVSAVGFGAFLGGASLLDRRAQQRRQQQQKKKMREDIKDIESGLGMPHPFLRDHLRRR